MCAYRVCLLIRSRSDAADRLTDYLHLLISAVIHSHTVSRVGKDAQTRREHMPNRRGYLWAQALSVTSAELLVEAKEARTVTIKDLDSANDLAHGRFFLDLFVEEEVQKRT